MKKQLFTVELSTKGAFEVEIALIEDEEIEVETLSINDAEELLRNGKYLTSGAFSDDFPLPFRLVVYDENHREIFKRESVNDIHFVHEAESVLDDDDFTSNANLQIVVQEWEKCWEKEREAVIPGIYVVAWHEMKWLTYRFVIEDDVFDPGKLFFVTDKKLEGLVYDDMTEPNHIFYDNKFVDVEDCSESSEEYGLSIHIMERCEDGYWDDIREVE